MNPRTLWASLQRWYATHSTRDRRILLGVGLAAIASLLYVVVVDPVFAYRKHVGEEIADGLEELERSARFLGAAESLRAEKAQLQKRLEEAKTRLLPGDSGTLGAAALQERANAIAATKGITVQSTQVMREEAADPFRKVSVRLTLSGELKPFADFLSSLEYGPQQLTVPFVEVSRRGAVAGQKGPRTLSATVEVSGFLRGAPEAEGKPEEPAAAEPETAAAIDGEVAPVPAEGEPAGVATGRPVPAPAGPGVPAAPMPPPQAPVPPPAAPQPSPSFPPPAAPPAAVQPLPQGGAVPAAPAPPPTAAPVVPPPPQPGAPPPPPAAPPPQPGAPPPPPAAPPPQPGAPPIPPPAPPRGVN